MDDVAAEAHVSRALVSLVMQDPSRVGQARREAVLAAVDKLGYRPNVLARNLASRHTCTIGIVINDLHNPYFVDVLDGIEMAATAEGYQLLLASGWGRTRSEQAAVDSFLDYRVDGVILAGSRLDSKTIVKAAKNAPVVVIGRSLRSELVDSINNDEAIGSRLAVDHLVELGHKAIAHIDGGSGAGSAARRAGYIATMNHHGLGHQIDVLSGNFTEMGGASAARVLLDRPKMPTAVFASNDLMAAGALNALEEGGLRIPGDISLVGYDNTTHASMRHMSLSTVHQPRERMGKLAVEALLERINRTRSTCRREVLKPSLIARSTSAPLPRQGP